MERLSKTMFTGPLVFVEEYDTRPDCARETDETEELDFSQEPDDGLIEWWRAMGGDGHKLLRETPEDWQRTPEEEELLAARESRRAKAQETVRKHKHWYRGGKGARNSAMAQNIRAEEMGRTGRLDPEEWLEWMGAFGGKCAYCGAVTRHPVIEHVVPVSKGGENTVYNTVPACWDCNARKRTKLLERWLTPTAFAAFFGRVTRAAARMATDRV